MQESIIKKHTINDIAEIIGDLPQADNLHIHVSKKNFKEVPLTYPFINDNFVLLLVVEGSLKLQLNLITKTIESSETIAVKPQTVVHILDMSENSELVIISFTLDFILKNSLKKIELDALDFFTANSIPKLKLSKSEIETSIFLSKLLEKKNTSNKDNITFKNEIISHCLSLILYHYASIFKKSHPNFESDLSRKEELTVRFLKILNENLKKERSVQFYASILCITSSHLSKVLKEVSGKTAGQLIDDAVIMESKILLKSPSLSIAEVANELQFSNQSFFGKYFKKHTGFSPSEFRRILKSTSR